MADNGNSLEERRKRYDPTRCEWNKSEIKRMGKTLYGNGGKGVEKIVTKLDVQMKIVLSMLTPILVGVLLMVFKLLGGS